MERAFITIFLIFTALTARDLFFSRGANAGHSGGSDDTDDERGEIKKEIPSISLTHTATGPTLKMLYCYSCGYRKAFEEYSNLIRDRFPHIAIVGDNYTPGFFRHKLVQVLTMLKLAIIVLILCNINPFQLMGYATPEFWVWMTQHKVYACLMTFFLMNTIESQLMSTGAFEIFYNDVPVWSKLTSGRIPSPSEMFEIIENQNKMFASQMNGYDIHTLPGRLQ